jgi:hypothetical protein
MLTVTQVTVLGLMGGNFCSAYTVSHNEKPCAEQTSLECIHSDEISHYFSEPVVQGYILLVVRNVFICHQTGCGPYPAFCLMESGSSLKVKGPEDEAECNLNIKLWSAVCGSLLPHPFCTSWHDGEAHGTLTSFHIN